MKRVVFSFITILAVSLTACGSLTRTVSTNSGQSSSSSLSELQLAVGILKLEDTENAVTTEQAPQLLMLWQVYQDLSQSDTAAQEEVAALFDQMRETLTAQQLQAINSMNITQKDVASVMDGVTITTSSSSSSSTTASSSAGMPAGGPPDGGGLPMDLGGAGSVSSTNQSRSAQTTSSLGSSANVPSTVVELVIQSLQKKIAA